jgi:hypothetical protein
VKASSSDRLTHSFVVGDSQLRKVCGFLINLIGNLSIEAQCSDGINRQFSSVDELIQYENPASKQITQLTIAARSDEYEKSADIRFNFVGMQMILIDISASEEEVSRLRSDVADVIAGTKPWFSAIARLDFPGAFVVIYGALLALLMVAAAVGLLGDGGESSEIDNRTHVIAQLFYFGTPLVLMGLGSCFNRLREKIFPYGTYLIGQGVERHRTLEKVRWTIVIGFFVSFLAGALVSLL